MIDPANESRLAGTSADGVGAKLRAARLQQGRSIEDVASELHMHVKQIDALENERFDQFPSVAFTKGYIRSYARVLGLDPAPLIDVINRAGIDDPKWTTHAPVEEVRTNGWLVGAGTAVVVALLGALSVAWLLGSGGWDQLRRHEEADAGPATERAAASAGIAFSVVPPEEGRGARHPETTSGAEAAPVTATGAPMTGDSAKSAVAATGASGVSSADAVQVPGGMVQDGKRAEVKHEDAMAASGTAPSQAAEGSAAAEAVSRGADRVRITLTEDCWVEIYDSARNKVIYGLLKAGDTREATGNAPFQVFLGFAPGVKLEYNGKPFDVAQYTKSSQTARFALVNE